MMIYLSKILPVFLLPLGVTMTLIVLGLATKRRKLILGALIILYISSLPLVGRQALKCIEGGTVRGLPQEAPAADAIVVLSGGRVVAPGKAKVSEWSDANRFFGGVELYCAGKAPLLIFTGGAAPWEPNAQSEGEILMGYAVQYGVPRGAVEITGKVFNTAGEAAAVAHILEVCAHSSVSEEAKPPSILLVTSAFHMARAKAQFEAQGLHVFTYPVDFIVSADTTITILDAFPTADALKKTELALRELYGRAFYSLLQRGSRN